MVVLLTNTKCVIKCSKKGDCSITVSQSHTVYMYVVEFHFVTHPVSFCTAAMTFSDEYSNYILIFNSLLFNLLFKVICLVPMKTNR